MKPLIQPSLQKPPPKTKKTPKGLFRFFRKAYLISKEIKNYFFLGTYHPVRI